jgi:hypothetical protein
MLKITKEQLIRQIKDLGIVHGDVVFIAADLLRVGYFSRNRKETFCAWLSILQEVVGIEGTLVIPAHTQSFFFFRKDRSCVFDNNAPTTSGALSAAFQLHPGVMRSSHPTNSCFAIGRYAEFILKEHDENASSYLPFMRVVDLGGKNLMIGAFADQRLAPMAMHCAQESLGLTRHHWAAGRLQSYYYSTAGKLSLFTRQDVGGCSAGGYRTIGDHILMGALNFGYVGNALSACIDSKKSYQIFLKIFKNNPNLVKCDDMSCPDCYGSPIYRHPIFWGRKLTQIIIRHSKLI